MTGVFRSNVPFDVDLLGNNLQALGDFPTDTDQIVSTGIVLIRFIDVMHDIHSRHAFIDWLPSPFLPGVRFNGNRTGLNNRLVSGDLRLFKQRLLIRVGFFFATLTKTLE